MALVLPSHDFVMGSAVGSGQQQVPSGFSTEGIHILLVDDENVSRMVVGNLLRKCNYKVTVADSGAQALELLRQAVPGTYQLILTDVMMPEVDGLEVLKYVRANEVLKDLPVVMMSANEQTDTVFQCIRGGAEEYLVKPVTKKEVQNIWQHVWKRQSSQASSPPQAQQGGSGQQTRRSSSSSGDQQEPAGSGPSSQQQAQQQQLRQRLQQHLQHHQQQLQQQHPRLHLMPLTQQQQDELLAQLANQTTPRAASSPQALPATCQTSQPLPPPSAAAAQTAPRPQPQQPAAAGPRSTTQPAATAAQLAARGPKLHAARSGKPSKVLLSKWLQRPNRVLDPKESTWLFCELLLHLEQLQQQGKAGPLLRVAPSNLMLHSNGMMSFLHTSPTASPAAAAPAAQPQEELLYLSPEEAAGQSGTAASSIYSLGVLFFELFYPLSEADRAHVLSQLVKDRIMPPQFLKQHPTEAAFAMSLLHPHPSSRPSLQELVQHEKLSVVCDALKQRRRALKQQEQQAEASMESEVLVDFLKVMQAKKLEEAVALQSGLAALDADISRVAAQLVSVQHGLTGSAAVAQQQQQQQQGQAQQQQESDSSTGHSGPPSKRQRTAAAPAPAAAQALAVTNPSVAARWENAKQLFPHLEAMFFKRKLQYSSTAGASAGATPSPAAAPALAAAGAQQGPGADAQYLQALQAASGSSSSLPLHLAAFAQDLASFCKYQHLVARSTMRCGDMLNTSNMICSIALDRDDEFFATAGVSKRMRIYEYKRVAEGSLGTQYPVLDISSRSRLSSVCWSSYVKSHMLSADYEGVVNLWDINTNTEIMQFEEHGKRVWSVDFSKADPTRLVSGSDDGTVKLWSISSEASVATIDTKVNVCCVQFSPTNSNLIAFGSANYRVYLYDLRNTALPLGSIAGHSKAVSYVRFLDSNSLVSASTDSTLRLWDVSSAAAEQPMGQPGAGGAEVVYKGHQNEKNFVGLSVLPSGYIACGSENNSVYCYHKSMPVPLASHSFSANDGLPVDLADVGNQFVSSVCWSAKHNALLAANSTGTIKVLGLE